MCPSTCAGTPESSRCGQGPSRAGQFLRTRSWLPPMPPEVTTTACAAISKSPDLGARAGLAAGDVAGLQHRPPDAGHRPAVDHELGHPVPEAQLDQPGVDGRPDPARERRDHARPGAPDDVEAGHRVAAPGRGVPAALGPADDGEEPDALLLEPGALLPRGELQVRLGPLPGPVVLGAVEPGRAEPVLPGQLQRVVHPQPPLLRRVDQEQPAERPPGLSAERRLGLLLEEDHPLAGVGQLGGGHETGETGPHDDDVGLRVLGHRPDASARRPGGAVPRASESSGGVRSTPARGGGWRGSGSPAARSSSARPTTPPPSRRGRRG